MSIALGAAGIADAKTSAGAAPQSKPQEGAQTAAQTRTDLTAPLLPDPLSGRQTTVTQLKNGLSVLILKDSRFPLVSTRLYVHAGSAYEKPEQAGISHVLEHMVFKGTERRPKGEVSREVEAAGGYINAATSYDYTVYITDMPARHWKLGIDAARDMAFHATLDAKELASEKPVILSELDMRMKDNPQGKLFERLLTDTLGGTPYQRPIIGYPETIKAITVQDMRNYIETYYQPRNMLLTVVGNVEPAEVLAEVERTFGKYVNTRPLTQPVPYDAAKLPLAEKGGARLTPTVIVEPGQWNKVYLAAAFPVPGFADYQAGSLDVLAYLLGGDRTSLFYKTFKYERQLVDSISVDNVTFERVGAFVVSAQLDADKVGEFWEALTKEFATVTASRFSPEELERAKVNLEDDLFRAKETLSGLASKLGYFQFFYGGSGGEQAEDNALGALRSVDKTMLDKVISAWLAPQRMSLVALPPEKAKMPDFAAVLAKNWPATSRKIAANVGQSGAVESIKLGNGGTLVLTPDTTMPYVSANLLYSGGDALLTPEEQGLSSLAAMVLTKGTAKLGAQEIQTFLSDRAAALGASAGRQSFTVNFTVPVRHNDEVFALLRDVVTSPAFAPEETARGVKDQVAAIRSLGDQPLKLVSSKLPPFLFPHSIFGYLQLGSEDAVQGFTPEKLRTFWDKQKRRPFVLSVAGSYDRDKVLAFAESLPGADEGLVQVPVPAWGKDKKLDISLPGRNQAHLMLIFKTVPDGDPAAPGLELLSTVLGGMGGPLFRELRDEQGLGYTVTAFNRQTDKMGYMVFYIGTEADKMARAEAGFAKILAETAKKPFAAADLERGKNQLEGDYYRAMQSLGSRSGEAAVLTLEGRPLSFSRDQIEKARLVSASDLRELAKKYLRVEDAYVVKVLP